MGGHLGGGWMDHDWRDITLTSEAPRFSGSGFVGGVHAGYQHQFGNFLAGVEVTYSGADVDGSARSLVSAAVSYRTGVENLFAVVGRLGIVSNRWHFYARGGYASGEVEFSGAEATLPDRFSVSSRRDGYVVGAGIEHLFTSNMLLGIEYNYVSLEGGTITGLTQASIPYTLRANNTDIQTVTARIGFKF
jgi:outer membrane immunogenic protein